MRIVVLCGPPCSGKTTLARRLAQPGDVVLDYDDIARALGSPATWIHLEPYRSEAEWAMQHHIAQAYGTPGGTAWVLRTAPRAEQRASLAAQWDAEVYVLDPGKETCLARAGGRPAGTRSRIGQWYHRHGWWSGDRDAALLINGR